MTLRLTDLAPNFDAETTQGKINFHKKPPTEAVVIIRFSGNF